MNGHRRTVLSGLLVIIATPVLSIPEVRAQSRPHREIPKGYQRIGTQAGVPSAILFAVALQESQRLFGAGDDRRPLPWPWTLNVEGSPQRFASQRAAITQLDSHLRSGKSLIDVGLMQVCWHYFHERLGAPARALDPYWNLRVGAAILREHYDNTHSWFTAIGRYHAPADAVRAAHYAARVLERMETLHHA